jgi:hypothetical protein
VKDREASIRMIESELRSAQESRDYYAAIVRHYPDSKYPDSELMWKHRRCDALEDALEALKGLA